MKNKDIYISFIVLIIAIIFSLLKTNHYIQKNINNSKKIIRYGNNIKENDILYINGNKEIVVEVLKDGSYITKILN